MHRLDKFRAHFLKGQGSRPPHNPSPSSRCAPVMVPNIVESWTGARKKLAGYIFVRCIAIMSCLPLSTDFAGESLLATLLCRLPRTDGGGGGALRNAVIFGTSLWSYANVWKDKTEWSNNVSWYPHVLHIVLLYSFAVNMTWLSWLLDCLH